MQREEIEKIVQREMPGHRLARRSQAGGGDAGDSTPPMPADATTPALDDLRRKYLRSKYLAPDAAADAAPEQDAQYESAAARDPNAQDDDVIVAVEPEAAAHPWDRAARPKAIVVSGKDKKIVGKQG